MRLLADVEDSRESEVLSLSTSGICSSGISVASDSVSMQPFPGSIDQRSPSFASVEAVGDYERELLSVVQRASAALDDRDRTEKHVEALGTANETHLFSTVNQKLDEGATGSGNIDTVESSSAPTESDELQEIAVRAKRATHGRSSSDGGFFRSSQSFPNALQHAYADDRQHQGAAAIQLLVVHVLLPWA